MQFHSTTLLELEHPFLTRLRLDSRHVRASEIQILPGDAVEVVGRLSRRLDPTVRSQSGRDPPQRRTLRSGTRVPVLIKKLSASGCGARARAPHRAAGHARAVARRAAAAPILIRRLRAIRARRRACGLAPPLHLLHTAPRRTTVAGQSPMTKKILVIATVLLVHTAAAHAQQSGAGFPTADTAAAEAFPPAYAPPPGYKPPPRAPAPHSATAARPQPRPVLRAQARRTARRPRTARRRPTDRPRVTIRRPTTTIAIRRRPRAR